MVDTVGDNTDSSNDNNDNNDDVTGAIPTQKAPGYAQAGPWTPEEDTLNSKEKFLDTYGVGTSSAKQRIGDQRQQFANTDQSKTIGALPNAQGEGSNRDVTSQMTSPLLNSVIDYAKKVYGINQTPPDKGLFQSIQEENTPMPRPRPDEGAIKNSQDQAIQADIEGFVKGLPTDDHPGAMPSMIAQSLLKHVDPDSTNPKARFDAMQYAMTKGGPMAALSFMQSSVAQYDASRAFAANGYDSKNIPSMTDALTKAFQTLPTKDRVMFSPSGQGITAAVIGEDGTITSHHFTPEQTRELSRGQSGFAYDVMSNGLNAAFDKLSGENHGAYADPNSQGVAPGPNGVVPESWKELGVNQATWNVGHQMFPWASQSAQRNAYFAAQANQREKYTQELAVAKQQGINRVDYAGIMAGGRKDVANINQEGANQRNENTNRTKLKVTDKQQEGLENRKQLQVDMNDRQTQAKLKIAHDSLVSRQGNAQEQERYRAGAKLLEDMSSGKSTPEATETLLKQYGLSLQNLLKQQVQTPTSGNAVPNAAQAAPPGATHRDTNPKSKTYGQWYDKDQNLIQ